MKKIIFSLVFLFSVFFSEIYAQYSFYVMFHVPTTWGNTTPKIHIFGTPYISDTTWPGITMEKTCNEEWFVYKVPTPASFVNFVINNGNSGTGNQTQDLTTSATVFYEYDTTASSNPAYIPLYNPAIPNTCVKINPASGTFPTGTNVAVTLESILTMGNTTPTIYYTTDGSEPTTTSQNFTGTGSLNYNSGNNTLKAMAYTSSTLFSATVERQYDFATTGINAHLVIEAPSYTSWINNPKIHYWNLQQSSGSMPTSTSWPGNTMYYESTNQFYYFFPNATSVNMIFDNGNSGTGNQSIDITNVTSDIWYYIPSGNIVLGTSEIINENKILVYPNPAKEYVTIASSNKTIKSINIINSTGMWVVTEKPISSSINISKLPKGIYLLDIHFDDETHTIHKISKE